MKYENTKCLFDDNPEHIEFSIFVGDGTGGGFDEVVRHHIYFYEVTSF